MSKIKILEENIANQIAAGEVVERPSSVIKELLENALDAGAQHIEILLEEGGLSRIVVSDNGEGMSPEDAVLCFSRHATSKIKNASDLEAISTFGFRGEALAAISSVSKVSLVTRRGQDESATKVEIVAGQIKYVGSIAGKIGTRIEIAELFFNTPARLKFLKSQRSEASYVEEIICDVAIAQPSVAFSFRNESKVKIDATRVDSELPLSDARRMERLVSLMGDETRGHLHAFEDDLGSARIIGYVASPLVSRRDTKGIRLFVNGRVIKDRNLSQAVQIAYRTLLEVGRKPICALNIELDPRLVDVNVHPQKSEVRFQESLGMQSKIIRSLQNFLATTPWLQKAQAVRSYVLSNMPFEHRVAIIPETPTEIAVPGYSRENFSGGQVGWNLANMDRISTSQVPMDMVKKRFFHELRILGQIDQTYLILDDGDGLVVIDQHAAHERVKFERLRRDLSENSISGQPLLFPKQIQMKSEEISALIHQQKFLSQFGFDVEPFGDEVAIIRAIPPSLRENEAEEMLKEFLQQASLNKISTSLSDWIDKICAQMACHGSIRAGQSLSNEQIEALLTQLDEIDYNAHCPHGRPTTRVFPYSELAKWFHRS